MKTLFAHNLQTAVEPLLIQLGQADRERTEMLVKLAVAERIRLSDVIASLYPGFEKENALNNLRQLRSRFNSVAREHKTEVEFVVDTGKGDPAKRWCWFTGADPTVLLAIQFSERGAAMTDKERAVESEGDVHDKLALTLLDLYERGDESSKTSRPASDKTGSRQAHVSDNTIDPARDGLPDNPDPLRHKPNRFEEPDGDPVSIEDAIAKELPPIPTGPGVKAVTHLQEWANTLNAPRFYTLLGEYGIGKTTTLKQLTLRMLEARQVNSDAPLPLYIDLRLSVNSSHEVPTLNELLGEVLARSNSTLTPRDLIRLVQQEGAVILFDGLDEKAVHYTKGQTEAFLAGLWKLLPKTSHEFADTVPSTARTGKLLISCRSHFFRTFAEQNAMLTGNDREGLDRKFDCGAFILRRFTEEQIASYLTKALGDPALVPGAMQLITEVHNLRELSERPYLLSLIAEHLGDLHQLRLKGEVVNAARLYQLFVDRWLRRDERKHQLDPEHKRVLMEQLAADLWNSGDKEWEISKLEKWFDQFLVNQPLIASAYAAKDRKILKEDLRTATFVLRPDTERSKFRFAHTSLQEFFLASYLFHGLIENEPDRWGARELNSETLNFVGQLLQSVDPVEQKRAIQRIEAILRKGTSLVTKSSERIQRAKCNALLYWTRAHAKGYPAPAIDRLDLAGLDLTSVLLWGIPSSRLQMSRSLAGTCLDGVRYRWVDFSGADFSQATLRRAEFQDCVFDAARFGEAHLGQCVFRNSSFREAELATASVWGAEWIGGDTATSRRPPDWQHSASDTRLNPLKTLHPAVLVPQLGHQDSVISVALSGDGQTLVSGSHDSTVKVWDARTGACRLTLKGHQDPVTSVALSGDGQTLVSGSSDNTVKVWDARTGACRMTLTGHQSYVRSVALSGDAQTLVSGSDDKTVKVWDARTSACRLTLLGDDWYRVISVALSGDGQTLVSGSYDKTVKVWDARTGACRLTLTGHQNYVSSVALSGDGQTLVSGSVDNTVKVWDARTGACRLTLAGHQSYVRSVALSGDGQTLVSGSDDNTVKVWDARTGACRLTLEGHQDCVNSVALSGDGQTLVSGSDDRTVKVWDARTGACRLTLATLTFSVAQRRVFCAAACQTEGPENKISQEIPTSAIQLPEDEWALISDNKTQLLDASPNAWRWLKWRIQETPAAPPRMLPYEALAPWTFAPE